MSAAIVTMDAHRDVPDLDTPELADIIDVPAIQALMDDFYRLAGIGIGLVDRAGRVLVKTGWQDICTQFHRVHPATRARCIESDTELTADVTPGTFKGYHCRNHLWDVATPIVVDGRRVGNLFLGQFLYADEQPDLETFRAQARQFGFDEQAYLAALARVPRWSRATVEQAMRFYARLADLIAQLSYAKLQLTRTVARQRRTEESLRQREAQYRLLAENSTDLISRHDPTGTFLYASPSYTTVLGYAPAELIGRSAYDITHPDDRGQIDLVRVAAVDHGTVGRATFRLLRKDGTPVWVETVCRAVRDPATGAITEVHAATRDVTEQHAAEQRHLAMAAMLDAAPNSITVHDAAGRFLYANRKTFTLHGYAPQEFMQLNLHELDTPESAALIDERVRAAMARGEAHFEVGHRRKDGSVVDLAVLTRPVEWAGIPALLSVATDITERKRTQAALQRVRYTVDNVTDALYWVAEDGRFIDVNDGACRMLGYTRDELLALRASDVDPNMPTDGWNAHWQEMTGRRFKVFTTVNRTRSGELIPVEIVLHRQRFADAEYICAVVRDITERRAAEAARHQAALWLENATQAGNIGLWDWDLATDRVTYSAEWKRQVGCAAHEVGDSFEEWRSRVHPDDLDRTLSHIRAVIAANRPGYRVEFRFRHRDGHYLWIMAHATIMRDPSGRPQRVIGSHVDITERRRAEQALRDSEARLNLALRVAHMGYWRYDCRTQAVDWSAGHEVLFGLTMDQFKGTLDAVQECVHPDDRAHGLENIRRAVEENVPFDNHYRVIHPDGQIRFLHSFGYVYRNEHGAPDHIFGVTQDVTERRAAEQALRDSEERLRLALRATNDVVWDWDILHDTQRWNESGAVVFGWTDIVAAPQDCNWWFERVHPDDHQRVHDGFAAVLDDPTRDRWEDEYRFRRADGSYAFVMDRGYVLRDATGRPTRMIGAMLDVTERHQTQAELERLRSAIEQAAEAIVITDVNGTIQYVNPAFERVTGYPRDTAIGQNPRILRSGEHDDTFYRDLWRTITSGGTWHGRLRNRRRDGALYTEDATISPVHDAAGRIINFVAVKRDITHELELEAQLRHAQKMDAIGQLAGGVAHDLNNTLTAIFGYLELARGHLPDDHTVSASLRGLEQAACQAAGVTRSLLLFSGRSAPRLQAVNLAETIAETVRLVRHTLPAGIRVTTHIAADTPLTVHGDPTQLQQVLMNLALNARDAMPRGGRLEITLQPVDEPAGPDATPTPCAALAVRDTGLGIPPEVLPRIFEPFFTTKARGQGTGLGLAIVHGIVHEHRGRITIDSIPGLGTPMPVLLPLLGETDSAADATAPAAPATAATGHGSVLLAEDQHHVRRVLAAGLAAQGYDVIEAADGTALMDRYRAAADNLRLLILDIDLPQRSGLACLADIRAAGDHTPAILITGQIDAHLEDNLDESTHLLRKPFRPNELADLATHLLREPSSSS
jgi:two-component system cell cycle sensor histidine kinase/response regulator CckA